MTKNRSDSGQSWARTKFVRLLAVILVCFAVLHMYSEHAILIGSQSTISKDWFANNMTSGDNQSTISKYSDLAARFSEVEEENLVLERKVASLEEDSQKEKEHNFERENENLATRLAEAEKQTLVLEQQISLLKEDSQNEKENFEREQNDNDKLATRLAGVEQNNNIIYGHVHMAKTGGSTINGWLAAKYERVCGNKGYSYNAYAANTRAFQEAKKFDSNKGSLDKGSGGAWVYNEDEIGFEDCDYISRESSASRSWNSINQQLNNKYQNFQKEKGIENTTNIIMELHIPCRDPIDHLLSMANHKARSIKQVIYDCIGFESNDTLLEQEVERGYFDMGRFSKDWLYMNAAQVNKDNIRIRCFNTIPVESYMAYMDPLLQKRRIPANYYPHATNPTRNKTNECVLDLPEETKDKIRMIMNKNHPYMKFCNRCMGTEQELPL